MPIHEPKDQTTNLTMEGLNFFAQGYPDRCSEHPPGFRAPWTVRFCTNRETMPHMPVQLPSWFPWTNAWKKWGCAP